MNTNYDDIKQVFSIWICMNMDYNSLSHIHLAKDEMLRPYDWKGNLDLLNIVMVGITNDIPEHDESYELHRLLGALLSSELKVQEKLDILEHEYNIPVDNEFREEVEIMCNLSTGIEERATEKTTEKIILNMYESKFSVEQISMATKKVEVRLRKLLMTMNLFWYRKVRKRQLTEKVDCALSAWIKTGVQCKAFVEISRHCLEYLQDKNLDCDFMVTTESITIQIPAGMSKYLVAVNLETELTRNALLLYPYILNQTISHGRAAEILGIRKSELIDLYDKLGYSYLDMTMDDLDTELNTFRELKKKEAAV